jgi:uncharacterized protein
MTSKSADRPAPAVPKKRIIAIDALRGFAVLGILIMNIQEFAMIDAAYLNPTAYGSLEGIHKWVWILSHIFADQKFMTIFSILFGAGIFMITRNAESRGLKSAGLHYRRTFWLLLIGLMHAYLLWRGDILVSYALCALLVFLFRKISPRWLVILGLLFIMVSSLIYLFFGWSMQFWPEEAYDDMMRDWKPSASEAARQVAIFQGGWLGQMPWRVATALKFQTLVFLIWTFWRVTGLMLIGIALFKWGVLTAERSRRFYARALAVGFCIGLPLVITGVLMNFRHHFSLDYSMFTGGQFNYWGSLFVSFGYINTVMLICRAGYLEKLRGWFAAVGRMAFTNYLLQSVICTLIFYGHGLALFGRVERGGQILVVFAVWIVLFIFSNLWLSRYRFGPVEWLWRTLTYLKRQPMKKK